MKTKPAEKIPAGFPTCGEAFHFLIAALDLTAWADVFHDHQTNRRSPADLKALSDQLRDWATEAEGRSPSRDSFEEFIRNQLQGLPRADELAFVLCNVWRNVLDNHADEVRENTSFLDRNGTRTWYAQTQAPRIIYFLWVLHKLLQRVAQTKGPMLHAPLDELLAKAWTEVPGTDTPVERPLQLACYKHYAECCTTVSSSVDVSTVAAWNSGEDRPSCNALGRHFKEFPDKLGLLLNFAFAGLLEALMKALLVWTSLGDQPDCRRLLLGQAHCLRSLDDVLTEALRNTPDLSLLDYESLLAQCLSQYIGLLQHLPHGAEALNPRVAKFRVYQEYHYRFAVKLPEGLDKFCGGLDILWRGTALKAPRLNSGEVTSELARMRTEYSQWSKTLAGPVLAIEARLALCHQPPTRESLQRALDLYQEALSASRYQAGSHTKQVAREALGLAALLHRRETSEGTIKPWIKKVLGWWDLLGFGNEFDHEQLDQRIERAESHFTDRLDNEIRARLKSALPQLGLNHWNMGGLTGFSESDLIEKLEASPVDRRQKKPMSQTIVGRDQTALMEAIDRRQLDLARELLHKGADLNFINSTGDTCVTKAFACKDYDLVLEILRRDNEPIRRETLLRVTSKMRISGLEQAISTGRVEILRELARPKPGRGEVIDLSTERILGQTPLYYAVNCLSFFRMGPEEIIQHAPVMMPQSQATTQLTELLGKSPTIPKSLEAVRGHLVEENELAANGVLECIRLLVHELHVGLDVSNTNEHTALTYSAERRLHDVAALLLAAGASVNHRFQSGGTALVCAIFNDDYEMAKLLVEYGTDYRLFVDALGLPIYAMKMSEKMRQLIPHCP